MASIYRLVAERKDRNQSLKRKRNIKNLYMFNQGSMEEIKLRRPELNRTQTMRKRTISDQPSILSKDTLGILKKPNDLTATTTKLNELHIKIDGISKRIEDLYVKLIGLNK